MGPRAYDVSEWGFFRFSGPDAKAFLQGLMTADVRRLSPGAMLPACVLTPKGLMVADCELYDEAARSVLVVARPRAAVGLLKTFEKKIMLSKSAMRVLSGRAWLVIGAGYERGLPWPRLSEPARLLIGADPPEEADILSESEFEVLRVACGLPWFGADMDEETLPLEARQESAISLDKGCYMGQETVSRLFHLGRVNRILVGLRFEGASPAAGTALTRGGTKTGKVTSSAGGLGLGMVRVPDSEPGTVLEAAGRRAEVYRPSSWTSLSPEPESFNVAGEAESAA